MLPGLSSTLAPHIPPAGPKHAPPVRTQSRIHTKFWQLLDSAAKLEKSARSFSFTKALRYEYIVKLYEQYQ